MFRGIVFAAFGLCVLALFAFVALQQARPEARLAFYVLVGPLLLGFLEPLLAMKGERDVLRIHESNVELPTRSLFEAYAGKPNMTLDIQLLKTFYVPPPEFKVPFLGFEDQTGRITLIHRDHAGDVEKVASLLRDRKVRVANVLPPPEQVVWGLPRWMARTRRPSTGSKK